MFFEVQTYWGKDGNFKLSPKLENPNIQDVLSSSRFFCIAQGILQPDMWGEIPSNRWDWDAVRELIAKNGVRNSLLVAPMPTASTSQILGNNECFEPYTSNIYSRRVLRFVLPVAT